MVWVCEWFGCVSGLGIGLGVVFGYLDGVVMVFLVRI